MIWLTGCNGMLGRLVAAELGAAGEGGAAVYATDLEVDLTDYDALCAGAPPAAPAWVVNCAAYTAVDQAESDAAAAWALNRNAPANLARWCAGNGARLLHLSTDYVFDGAQPDGGAYPEDAPANPQSVYGASKVAGEEALREALGSHAIVRTAWLYAEHGRNFVLTMLRLLREREELTVVNDQYGSPTYARDLARAIATILRRADPRYGTFHFTNAGVTTWYDFACAIQAGAVERGLLRAPRQIRPVASDQYPTAARRPMYSALDCSRLIQSYAIEPRPWQEALADCLDRIVSSEGGKK